MLDKFFKMLLMYFPVLMFWTDPYDKSTPAGSDDPTAGDDRIREAKGANQEIQNEDHYWPLNGDVVDDADAGLHRKSTYLVGSAPTKKANAIIAYGKDVSSVCELFAIDESGNERQLSGPNMVAQIVVDSDSTEAGLAGTEIPYDDTIPQNTEGDEIMTLAITPKDGSNTLFIEVSFAWSINNRDAIILALFQDSIANALCAVRSNIISTNNDYVYITTLTYKVSASDTSARTYKIRAGEVAGGLGGTITKNGTASASKGLGGIEITTMKITEISA